MFPRGKANASPSDPQARDKLVLYVYEYLVHMNAKNAAQTFLQEIHWDKNIQLGENPGFLQSWWCVFWDLYCAAPERRDTPGCEYSNEAKAFHDYGFIPSFPPNGFGHGPAVPPPGSMPGPDVGPPGGPAPFIHFGGPGMPPGPMAPMHNCIDTRQGVAGGSGQSPAPMGPGGPMPGMLPPGSHPRMGAGTPPTAASISGPQPSRVPQNFIGQQMNCSSSPLQCGQPIHPGMSPLPAGPPGGRQWPGGPGVSMTGGNNNYTSASPVHFGGAPGSVPGATGPGTPGTGCPSGTSAGPPGSMMNNGADASEMYMRQMANTQAQQVANAHMAAGVPNSQMQQFLAAAGGGPGDGVAQMMGSAEMTHLLNNELDPGVNSWG